MVARLGWVLFWFSKALAGISFTLGFGYAALLLLNAYQNQQRPPYRYADGSLAVIPAWTDKLPDAILSLLAGLIVGALAYVFGRACRYVLANQ